MNCVIVGQNYPDRKLFEMVEAHERTIVFEPLPDAAKAIRHMFAYDPRVFVYQAACGERSIWAPQPFQVCNTRGLSSSLGSVSDAARERYSTFDLSTTDVIQVKVINLHDFLVSDGVEDIETLLIDAQGMDLTILKTMEPFISKSKIKHIECEADGDGLKMYDGLPSNSVEDFQEFMRKYPQYKGGFVPNRVSFNPDLFWDLQKS